MMRTSAQSLQFPIIEYIPVLTDQTKTHDSTFSNVKTWLQHGELDEPFGYHHTFETLYGRYRLRRVQLWILPAPEIIQHGLELAILNLPGNKDLADDILINKVEESEDEAIHDHRQS